MDRLVRHQNIVSYKKQLEAPADETERLMLLKLLAEEHAKERVSTPKELPATD